MALAQFASLRVKESHLSHSPSRRLIAQSGLVRQANGAAGELLPSEAFVECFQSLSTTIRSHDSLLGTDLTYDTAVRLGDEIAAALRLYGRTCAEILGKLQAAYEHILNAKEDKAIEFFSDIAKGTIGEVIVSTKNLQESYENAYKVFDKKARATLSPPAATEIERFERELAEVVVRYDKNLAKFKRIRLNLGHTISPTHDVTKAQTSSAEAVSENVHPAAATAVGSSAKSSFSEDKTQGLTEALTSPLAIWKQHPLSRPCIRSSNTQVRSGPHNATKTLLVSLLNKRERTLKQAREYQDELEEFHEVLLDNISEGRASALRTLCTLEVILSIIKQATKFWLEAGDYYKTSADICSTSFRDRAKELLSIIHASDRMKKWDSDDFKFKAEALKFVALWTALANACDESARKIAAIRDATSGDKRRMKKDETFETLKRKIVKFMQEVRKEEEQLKKEEGQINV